jgi:nicotinate-nucleotide adenylyltransferase
MGPLNAQKPKHAADPIPRYGDRRRMRIGLLGGSFNPAHDGHLHIAMMALRRLRLAQVWLLVSPGNPLKEAHGMPSLAKRLKSARKIADGRRIVATGIEQHLHTRYTFDTLRELKRRFPRARFVWLMGADNLSQFPHWRGWMGIARTVPFAVLPRPTYTGAARAGQAAQRLARARHAEREAPALAGTAAPAWVFLSGRENPVSATALRKAAAGEDRSPGNPPRLPRPAPRSLNAAPQNHPPP